MHSIFPILLNTVDYLCGFGFNFLLLLIKNVYVQIMQENQEFREYLKKTMEALQTMKSDSVDVHKYISLLSRVFDEIMQTFDNITQCIQNSSDQ